MINGYEELMEKMDEVNKNVSDIDMMGIYVNSKKGNVEKKFFNKNVDEEFLKKEMGFDYDNGYGGEELFGVVCFKDGSWLERMEYDGSEWWEYKKNYNEEMIMNMLNRKGN